MKKHMMMYHWSSYQNPNKTMALTNVTKCKHMRMYHWCGYHMLHCMVSAVIRRQIKSGCDQFEAGDVCPISGFTNWLVPFPSAAAYSGYQYLFVKIVDTNIHLWTCGTFVEGGKGICRQRSSLVWLRGWKIIKPLLSLWNIQYDLNFYHSFHHKSF